MRDDKNNFVHQNIFLKVIKINLVFESQTAEYNVSDKPNMSVSE